MLTDIFVLLELFFDEIVFSGLEVVEIDLAVFIEGSHPEVRFRIILYPFTNEFGSDFLSDRVMDFILCKGIELFREFAVWIVVGASVGKRLFDTLPETSFARPCLTDLPV